MNQVLLVACFGAVGAVSRFLLSAWMLRVFGDRFPWGTFSVNVIGCALMGVLYQWQAIKPMISQEWQAGLTAGFLGGLTTFSSFGLETIRLVELGRLPTAAANVLANLCFGLIAVWIGMLLTRRLIGVDVY